MGKEQKGKVSGAAKGAGAGGADGESVDEEKESLEQETGRW